jgi:hypothetical protein
MSRQLGLKIKSTCMSAAMFVGVIAMLLLMWAGTGVLVYGLFWMLMISVMM